MAMSNVRRYLPGRRRRERKFAGKADVQWLRSDRYVTFARTNATRSWIGPGLGSFTENIWMDKPRRGLDDVGDRGLTIRFPDAQRRVTPHGRPRRGLGGAARAAVGCRGVLPAVAGRGGGR